MMIHVLRWTLSARVYVLNISPHKKKLSKRVCPPLCEGKRDDETLTLISFTEILFIIKYIFILLAWTHLKQVTVKKKKLPLKFLTCLKVPI